MISSEIQSKKKKGFLSSMIPNSLLRSKGENYSPKINADPYTDIYIYIYILIACFNAIGCASNPKKPQC